MTREEIIKLANETELCQCLWIEEEDCIELESVIAFAKLVAAKERLDCFDAAYQAYATSEVLKAIRARGEA